VGIRDLFSSSGRAKSRLEKLIRTTTNKYTQSAERYHAMEQLLADGSDEALVGLLRRFTITSSKSIEDEEEKGWVYRQLSELGERALPSCKEFCLSHHNIAWALRIVEDVANAEQEWDLVNALLEAHPPEYERDPATKIQLLTHVAEIDDPRVPEILAGYLEDPDETVRFFVVEQLIDIGDEHSRKPLVDRLANPKEDSLRLRMRIVQGLAELGWDVSDSADVISANLGSEYMLRAGKVVSR
jgi:hypothetical protein